MNLEKKENNELIVTGAINEVEFNESLDHAFNKVKDKVEIKGFRKGKITREIFEKHYSVESLFDEAINHALNQKFIEIAQNKDNNIVGFRKVDLKEESLSKSGFEFTMILVTKPSVTLGKYKKLKVKKADFELSKEEVQKEIDSLLTKDAILENKESNILELNDTAIFDFDGYLDGVAFEGGKAENYSLEIGSHQFIPGFEEQMIGMKTEEEKELPCTFPEEYHAENLKGKEVIFKVKLHEIKTKSKKELNDEFVVSLKRENINTVLELENSIKETLAKSKEKNENNRIHDELVRLAVDFSEIDVPTEMLETQKSEFRKQVENQAKQYQMDMDTFLTLTGSSKEKFEDEIEVAATQKVKSALVLEEIAKLENLVATQEQIENKYDELSKMHNMEISKIKEVLPKESLEDELIFKNAVDFLVNNADFE